MPALEILNGLVLAVEVLRLDDVGKYASLDLLDLLEIGREVGRMANGQHAEEVGPQHPQLPLEGAVHDSATDEWRDLLLVLVQQVQLFFDLFNRCLVRDLDKALVLRYDDLAFLLLVEYQSVFVSAANGTASTHATSSILEMPLLTGVLLKVAILVATLIEN